MAAFEIGVSLTGTVSAGPYTAGVIDFLFQALEEWEKAKTADRDRFGDDYSKWTVPWHDVNIRGLSGASGGGVMNGLVLNNIGKDFPPVLTPPADRTAPTGNDFFDAWVLQLGIGKLLSTEDLDQKEVKSILNANAIPDIANRILQKANFGSTYKRPYIDPNLISIVTISNLAGIPVEIRYEDPNAHTVVYYKHADYQMIELSQNGRQNYPESYFLPMDPGNPNFDSGYATLKALCVATCAFPAAFKAQPVTQLIRKYLIRGDGNAWSQFPGDTYTFLCVDGGVFNTEPFELLHDKLLRPGETSNPHDPNNVVRAIISVAPLETFERLNTTPGTDDGLFLTLEGTVSSLRQDALMNDEQIQKAFDEGYYSRYIIAPVRSSSENANDMITPAITGTTLGSFGAFLSMDFRLHDYFLGRRNAQQFLRNHFAIPVANMRQNPIFRSEEPYTRTSLQQFLATDSNGQKKYFPIIPLCGTAADPAPLPEWPTDKGYTIGNIQDLLTKRVDALLNAAEDSLNLGFFAKLFVDLIKGKAESLVVDAAIGAIRRALSDAKL